GAAELDQQAAGSNVFLGGERRAQAAEATRQHDRLVISPILVLESPEVTAEVGPAKLVVERRGPDRPLEHDVERRSDARRLAGTVLLPRQLMTGNAQVRDREADQAGLGLGAAPGRTLVADLAARAGGRAGKRRDRGR